MSTLHVHGLRVSLSLAEHPSIPAPVTSRHPGKYFEKQLAFAGSRLHAIALFNRIARFLDLLWYPALSKLQYSVCTALHSKLLFGLKEVRINNGVPWVSKEQSSRPTNSGTWWKDQQREGDRLPGWHLPEGKVLLDLTGFRLNLWPLWFHGSHRGLW